MGFCSECKYYTWNETFQEWECWHEGFRDGSPVDELDGCDDYESKE